MFYHGFSFSSNPRNNFCFLSVLKILQRKLLIVRSHGIHFKMCAVLANYKSVYLGLTNCNEEQQILFFKD